MKKQTIEADPLVTQKYQKRTLKSLRSMFKDTERMMDKMVQKIEIIREVSNLLKKKHQMNILDLINITFAVKKSTYWFKS